MRKILIGIISALILLLLIAGTAKYILSDKEVGVADNWEGDSLYLIPENGRYGFIDKKGDVAIKADLLYARQFSDGLAAVRLDNLLKQECFIDSTGKVAFNRDINKTRDFHEGMAYIWDTKTPENRANRTYLIHGDLSLRYGFINKEGKVIVKPKFKDVENFSEGLAAVKNEENKWGYINKEGVYEIEPKFDIAYSFNDGLAPVILDLDNPEYSYIDKKGNVVISPHFGSPSIPSEGLILGSATPGTIVCINYKGEVVFSIKGDSAGYFKDGIAPYSIDRKWGFINREGKIVIEPNFDRVHVFSEGLAAVQVDYKWGFIYKRGRFVVEAEFDSVSDFKDGIAEVFYVKDSIVERYAYIDTKGEFIWKSW